MLEPTIAIVTTPMVTIATGRGGNPAVAGGDGAAGGIGSVIVPSSRRSGPPLYAFSAGWFAPHSQLRLAGGDVGPPCRPHQIFCTTPCISAADGPERLPSWKK